MDWRVHGIATIDAVETYTATQTKSYWLVFQARVKKMFPYYLFGTPATMVLKLVPQRLTDEALA